MDNHTTPEHSSPIKTPKQLFIVVILAFILPVVILLMLANLALSSHKKPAPSPTQEEATTQRIAPIAQMTINPNPAPLEPAGAASSAPAPAPAVASGSGDASKGKGIYEANCAACHASGVAGAPKAGDKAAWAPRLKTGKDALYASVLKGKGAMPAKGGNAGLADADVKAAVDYLSGFSK